MTKNTPEQLLGQLRWRYATKAFDPQKKISEEDLSTLEEALVLTPSSFGLQPWHFFVIENTALRSSLLEYSWNQVQVTDCSHFVVLAARTDIDDVAIDEFLAHTAEVRQIDVSTLSGYRDMMSGFISQMSPEEKLDWAKKQTYLALNQLMTSAAALGIDACPMEGIIPAKYDDILNLSEQNLTTSVACALGYRSDDDKYAQAAKVRFAKSQVLSRLA